MMKMLIGAAIGTAVGYAMFRFVGCRTGACPLTANPWISMALYGLLGAMVMSGR